MYNDELDHNRLQILKVDFCYFRMFHVLFIDKQQNKKAKKRKSAFDKELTNTGKSAVKKFRSGYVILLVFSFIRTRQSILNCLLFYSVPN